MNRRDLIGTMCVLAVCPGISFSGEVLPDGTPLRVLTPPNTSWEGAHPSGGVVKAAHGELAQALIVNDTSRLLELYRDDARSLPDQQPRLLGRGQIEAWHRSVQTRRRVTAYVPQIREVFDFGDTLLEYGGFTITWEAAGPAEGKYLHVWGRDSDGSLRLKADVRNWTAPLKGAEDFFVAMQVAEAPPVADSALARELAALNAGNADGIKQHDLERRLSFYADDAVIMPHSVKARTGMAEIRPFLTDYVNNGRGATFDKVEVWNEGFEDLGHGYVLEYFKFHVDWRAGGNGGTVTGGGIRLWRRDADGRLKMLREIGTHDYRG
ncbi:hypothetical protein ABI_28860 [Asticcacaulis biprosthecium C19]|uniref:DUF4440 domain-containing protein n=1 Tax=Asticcacaulis biprosthecium C19 TaxID=715226 RepID=F4QMM8_9CAUL|nr:DUF4440 domain-containing protein [Asticcacaulis biprosthecium]EGF91469.1 hypothetical protein ABI_28860 [Asticcacaulis biprosthecium C19]